MGRASFAFLLAMLALFVFVALPKGGEGTALKRATHWEQKLEKDVPLGSTKDRLLEWAKENNIEFTQMR